ncbi:MAG: HupE/UreJ family protein [Nitrospiraceae bacterium]
MTAIRARMLLCCLGLAGLLFTGSPAWAHQSSDSYLTLSVEGGHVTARWDVALRDLDEAVGLDTDDDGRLLWGDVRTRWHDLESYVFSRLDVAMGGSSCSASPTEPALDHHSDGAYAVFQTTYSCLHPMMHMEVSYRFLFDIDTQHRGLVQVWSPHGQSSLVLSPSHRTDSIRVDASQGWGTVLSYAHEGVHHIWSGIDHLLFVLALLLPAVLRRGESASQAWRGTDSFRRTLLDVAAVITAFTVAHSITLAAAALGVVSLPTRLIESTIALSVALAALNNIVRLVPERVWVAAFVFGLVHGFGFAGALSDLGLVDGQRVPALLGFNLGVEAGQLVVVALVLPLMYWARNLSLYRPVVVAGGSCAIIVVALCWAIERMFDVQLLPVI